MLRALFITVIVLISWACTNSSGRNNAAIHDAALHASDSPKILLELFTSQGCSSCPAADKVIGDFSAADTNIISLAFHVDYWDRSGWKDIFSNHDYTLRQQQYVSVLHAASLYTPQAIVQGKYEMVGSNRKRLTDAISKVKQQAQPAQKISASNVMTGKIARINYQLSSWQPKQQVIIVLVQNKAATSVAKGENAGARLTEYNVVRDLIIRPAQDNGSQEISLPDDLEKKNASIIIFTQDKQTKEIESIAQLHF